MRRLLYIIVALALLAVPAERADVGELLPVETVFAAVKQGKVEIRTDTGNAGSGEDLESAYGDLQKNASGRIFLDTADYLILGEGSEGILDGLRGYLKPGIRVCRSKGVTDLEKAAQYLSIHTPKQRLRDIENGMETEELKQTEKGFILS